MELNFAKIADAIAQMPEQHPVCAYLYDLPALQHHVQAIRASLPGNCELFYAVKANSDLPILQTVAPFMTGFEAASGGEVDWLRRHFPKVPVIFGGPGKSDADLISALELKVELLHVESIVELQRLAYIAAQKNRTVDVLLRINLPLDETLTSSLAMGGRSTQFGIEPGQLEACLAFLKQHPQIRCRGFHFHLLSHQLNAQNQLKLIRLCFEQVEVWCKQYALTCTMINVGGGFGINYRDPEYQFDWDSFAAGLRALISSRGLTTWKIRLEPGRIISAACGYYAAQVIDIKQSFGRHYAVCHGGSHHFRTPSAQGHSHPFKVIAKDYWPYPFERPGVEKTRVTVVGQLCTPKDILVHDAPVAKVRIGDVLVFPYAGAYAWHISHHDFLRHPHPDQIYLPLKELNDVAA